jgi:transglutaminase-like putative cysteine protease
MKWRFPWKTTKTAAEQDRLPTLALFWLMACVATSIVPHLFHLPLWVLAYVMAIWVWRYRIEKRGGALPSGWRLHCVTLGFVAFLFLQKRTLMGLEPGIAMMVGMMGGKILETKTLRDYHLVVFVCYFLVLGALLFSQTIQMCVLLLVVLGVITAGFVAPSFRFGRDQGRQAILRFSGLLVVQALPLTVILFLLFPRVDTQMGLYLGQAKIGLTDVMRPGSISNIIDNDEVAFRVEIMGEERVSTNQMYWRAFVLTAVQDGTWIMHPDGYRVLEPPSRETVKKAVEQKITVMPHNQRWLFALDHPVTAPPGSELHSGTFLQSRSRVTRKRQYMVTSDIGSPLPGLSATMRAACLQMPDRLDPRVRALALRWKGQHRDPEAIMNAALAYYREEGFRYTRNPGVFDGDATAAFLFDKKEGYCEHFSSAFAILMRAAGLPARVVAGYQGGELNPYGNFILVRQSNAHAWNEVWIEGQGWFRVDATTVIAPQRLDLGIEAVRQAEEQGVRVPGTNFELFKPGWQPEWARQGWKVVQQRWDWLNEQWDEMVMGYDQESQMELAEKLGFSKQGLPALAAIMVAGLVLSLSILFLLMRKPRPPEDEAVKLYRVLCKKLARQGVPRHPWEGPHAYARRASEIFPAASREVTQLGDLYADLRYGPGSGRESRLDEFRRCVKTLKLEKTERP